MRRIPESVTQEVDGVENGQSRNLHHVVFERPLNSWANMAGSFMAIGQCVWWVEGSHLTAMGSLMNVLMFLYRCP